MSNLHVDYGQITIGVLEKAWRLYGRFTRENQKDVAEWVQRQMYEIKDGIQTYEPPLSDAMREFPRT